jgi:hypothetical protein
MAIVREAQLRKAGLIVGRGGELRRGLIVLGSSSHWR